MSFARYWPFHFHFHCYFTNERFTFFFQVSINLTFFFLFTDDSVSVIAARKIEDVFLESVVREVVSFYLDGELLHQRARVPCLGVRIRVPCLFFGDQRRLGQQTLEPAWQMTAHVKDFVCVLAATARTVAVRLVLDDLDAATGTLALFSRFFLHELQRPERDTDYWSLKERAGRSWP